MKLADSVTQESSTIETDNLVLKAEGTEVDIKGKVTKIMVNGDQVYPAKETRKS